MLKLNVKGNRQRLRVRWETPPSVHLILCDRVVLEIFTCEESVEILMFGGKVGGFLDVAITYMIFVASVPC